MINEYLQPLFLSTINATTLFFTGLIQNYYDSNDGEK
jgi:hypothetical protein